HTIHIILTSLYSSGFRPRRSGPVPFPTPLGAAPFPTLCCNGQRSNGKLKALRVRPLQVGRPSARNKEGNRCRHSSRAVRWVMTSRDHRFAMHQLGIDRSPRAAPVPGKGGPTVESAIFQENQYLGVLPLLILLGVGLLVPLLLAGGAWFLARKGPWVGAGVLVVTALFIFLLCGWILGSFGVMSTVGTPSGVLGSFGWLGG